MSTGRSTFSNLLKAADQTSLRPVIQGFSTSSIDGLNKALGPRSQGMVLAQIMPSIPNKSIPVVNEYLKLLQRKNAKAAHLSWHLEGFVHAKLLLGGFKAIGTKLTTNSFIKGFESLSKVGHENSSSSTHRSPTRAPIMSSWPSWTTQANCAIEEWTA